VSVIFEIILLISRLCRFQLHMHLKCQILILVKTQDRVLKCLQLSSLLLSIAICLVMWCNLISSSAASFLLLRFSCFLELSIFFSLNYIEYWRLFFFLKIPILTIVSILVFISFWESIRVSNFASTSTAVTENLLLVEDPLLGLCISCKYI
jgi:hypothetical protein